MLYSIQFKLSVKHLFLQGENVNIRHYRSTLGLAALLTKSSDGEYLLKFWQ